MSVATPLYSFDADILTVIFRHIDDGRTYKTAVLVCRLWHRVMLTAYSTKRFALSNPCLTLIERLIGNPALPEMICFNGWVQISECGRLTWDFIISHPDLPWSWTAFSKNRRLICDVNIAYVKQFMHRLDRTLTINTLYQSDGSIWQLLTRREAVDLWRTTHEWMQSYMLSTVGLPPLFASVFMSAQHWRSLSSNPTFTLQYIIDNPDLPWEWDAITTNSRITLADVLEHPELPWNYGQLICNSNITWADTIAHPELPWDVHNAYSLWKPSDLAFIRAHPDLNWDWESVVGDSIPWDIVVLAAARSTIDWSYMSEIVELPVGFILSTCGLPLDPQLLSINWSVTSQIINDNPDVPWNYAQLSRASRIEWEFVFATLDRGWDMTELSGRWNLTLSIVLAHPTLRWNWTQLSSYASITWEDVLSHPELPWDYVRLITYNSFDCEQ